MIHHPSYPIQELTTLGVGGTVDDFYIPESQDELLELIARFRKEGRAYRLLGNGSNLFVASKRISTPVIQTKVALSGHEIQPTGEVRAGAAVDIRTLINACANQGLRAPVELLTIPATVGGAIYMNAGRTSYKVSISQQLVSVTVFDGEREFVMTRDECRFGHRFSIFHERRDLTILSANFRFERTEKERIQAERKETLKAGADKCYRTQKSAGSVFKVFDWELMKKLQGLKIGDATFAPKTPNCILNTGKATPLQIRLLIGIAKVLHRIKRKPCQLEIEVW